MTALAEQPSKPRATWPVFSEWLRRYQYEWALAERIGLGKYPGAYLAVSVVVLTLLGLWTRYAPAGSSIQIFGMGLAWAIAVYYIFDALMVHTSIAYITRKPDYPLRSAVLTMIALLNVVHAFALIYILHGHRFHSARLRYPRALFYSLFTATTLGDTFNPGDDPLLLFWTALQVVVTLYFLAVIVAIIVTWSSNEAGERS